MSNMDVTNAYHHGSVTPFQVGEFAYVVSKYGCLMDIVFFIGDFILPGDAPA